MRVQDTQTGGNLGEGSPVSEVHVQYGNIVVDAPICYKDYTSFQSVEAFKHDMKVPCTAWTKAMEESVVGLRQEHVNTAKHGLETRWACQGFLTGWPKVM